METKDTYYSRHVRPSVSLSTCMSVSTPGRILMKLYIENAHENKSGNDIFSAKITHKIRLCFHGMDFRTCNVVHSDVSTSTAERCHVHCGSRLRHNVTFYVPCLPRSW
jgi:hypothetical protein